MSYTLQIAVALAAIQRAGTRLAYTQNAGAGLDPTTGLPTSTPTAGTVDAVVLPATKNPNLTVEQNALVTQNNRQVLIAGSSWPFAVDPQPNDTLVAEGATWTVKGSTRLAPDGGAAIYFDAVVAR